jgi:hypothetical protein
VTAAAIGRTKAEPRVDLNQVRPIEARVGLFVRDCGRQTDHRGELGIVVELEPNGLTIAWAGGRCSTRHGAQARIWWSAINLRGTRRSEGLAIVETDQAGAEGEQALAVARAAGWRV